MLSKKKKIAIGSSYPYNVHNIRNPEGRFEDKEDKDKVWISEDKVLVQNRVFVSKIVTTRLTLN